MTRSKRSHHFDDILRSSGIFVAMVGKSVGWYSLFSGLLLFSAITPASADGAAVSFGRACQERSRDIDATLKDYLGSFESARAAMEHLREQEDSRSDFIQASEAVSHCTKAIVDLVIPLAFDDAETYLRLMRVLETEGKHKPKSIIALADLGMELQTAYETRLPLYYEQDTKFQQNLATGVDLGFALGLIWSLKSAPQAERAVLSTADVLRGATAMGGVGGLSATLSSRGRHLAPPPALLLSYASGINQDAFQEVTAARYHDEIAARLLGIAAAVSAARAASLLVAEDAPPISPPTLLLKGGAAIGGVALGFWADSLVREAATGLSDVAYRELLTHEITKQGRTLERASAAKDANGALLATHRLLEAALKLSALQSMLAIGTKPSDWNISESIQKARDFEGERESYLVPADVARYLARAEMVRRLSADGDLHAMLAMPRAERGPAFENPVVTGFQEEFMSFMRQTRVKDIRAFLEEREGQDEHALLQDFNSGNIRGGGGELWLQIRALLRSLHRQFMRGYIDNIVEPRIARGAVTAELLSRVRQSGVKP